MFRHSDPRKTCRSSAAAEVGSSSDNGPLAPLWASGAEPRGDASSGNLTRARARIRAAWLISTEPLHRRYGQPAKRDCQAGTKRYVARHWGLTHSSHERRATGGRRGPNRPTRLHTRNVVNRLLAVPEVRDRRCHRKAHRADIRQFIREEAKAVL